MARETETIIEAFVQWAKRASEEELTEFADDISEVLYDLEENDYFGTEGLNKRFA